MVRNIWIAAAYDPERRHGYANRLPAVEFKRNTSVPKKVSSKDWSTHLAPHLLKSKLINFSYGKYY